MSRPKVYTWGQWRFEPHEYRLMQAGEQVTLAVKSLDLLALLVSRAPRLVTKADILNTVWPDAAVEEGNIAFHVAALRKALDAEGEATCIETVRGRGYRFVAPIEAAPVVIPPSTPSLDLPPEIRAMPIATGRPWIRLAVALWTLVIVVAGGAALVALKMAKPAPILITPFTIEDAAGSADNLADSVTQSVVTTLIDSGVGAVMKDRASDGDTPRTAASKMGANMLLTGNMTLTDEKRWQVSVRLYRADDGGALWAWQFVAPYIEHRNQAEEQIAKRVADGVKSYLTLSGGGPVSR
jgi:DNA-binding winged helix-turn-helix (wHTH) protein/TolB-like protein